ncbi:DUF6531 domain-containing protein [Streptomyces carpaticus]|uniref:DUF6531 domain-containing protein n=1 Tax=Streptomyces carpaticus TaxID=285558 RepID=A0ABV4ZK57_9ACTN
MGRASDWSPVDMESDPTPGDPDRVEELADKLLAFADDVADAQDKLRNLMGDGLLDTFVGETADAFGEQMEGVPPNLVKLNESHELAGQALATYWPKLRQAQQDADRALADAVEAQEDLSSAQSWLETAASSLETAQEAAEPPDEGEVRAEVRRALTDAESDHEDAEAAVSSAQGRLDAAKLLAQQAKEAREEAASLCVSDLRTASEAGIRNKKWWEKAVDWVADNWDTIVQVAQIIGTIVGIATLFIGGPLVAGILLAVALVALADTLVAYSKGEASLWDVGFAVLDAIPGGRLVGAGASAARTALRDTATTIRGQRPQIRQDGRRMDSRNECGDPVDVATGELVMSATDLTLPGVLPLVLERHHISTYRSGGWFGRSWASTLDQRLRLDDYGVRFYSADGMILSYPIPLADPEHPVLPTEGPRWELIWDGQPGTGMRVHQPETGRTLHFTPLPTRPGPELPLTAVTDRNGNRITIHYTEDGAPAEMEHSGGYRVHIATYDKRVTALHLASDPERPLLLSFGYDAHGNLSKIYNSSGLPLRFTYDDRARLIRWEDRNHTWYRYEYDAEGRVVFSTGTERALEYRYTYEPEHHRTTATNSLGHDTLYQFNDSLQLIAETDPLGNTTHRTWDRYDRPLSVIDALGRSTHYERDESGRVTTVKRPDGSEVRAEYDLFGLPARLVQPDGSTWQLAHDDRGNRVSLVNPAGHEVIHRFDANGAVSAVTHPDGTTTRVTNDAAGLPVHVTACDGTTVSHVRDAFGRMIETTDADGHTSRSEWSVEGKPLRTISPSGGERSWTWDGEGNCLSQVDEEGRTTTFQYGPFDLLRSRSDPDGARYLFQRDSELRIDSIINPLGFSWNYTYDSAGRLVSEKDFNGRAVTYSYDATGDLDQQTDSLGHSMTLRRNALGLVTEKTLPTGTTHYAYDLMGRMVAASGPDCELVLQRDVLGQIVRESINGASVTHSYDTRGRLATRHSPSGHTSAWTYSVDQKPDTLTAGSRILQFGYSAGRRETRRALSSKAEIRQSWDILGNLAGQDITVDDRALVSRTYAYRGDSRLAAIHDGIGESTTRYTHDELGRIGMVDRPEGREVYTYDTSGNVLSAHWDDSIADTGAAGERFHDRMRTIRAGRYRYHYDEAGRVVLRQRVRISRKPDTWRYSWNDEDQLTSVVTPDGTKWTYRYDPLGRRIAKCRSGPDGTMEEEITFSWSGHLLIEEGSSTGHTVTWDYCGNRPVLQTVRPGVDEESERTYDIVTDAVGTPQELIDQSGRIAWQHAGTVWGATQSPPGEAVRMPLRFPGQYADEETGWHYNVNRHYDPDTARYVSADPLGLAPAPHPYAYVPDPHAWADPLGLSPHPWQEEFNALPQGRQPHVREAASTEQMRGLYDRWTEGATRMNPRGTKIPDVHRLEDGTVMQWRTSSASGGATIDIFPLDGSPKKVHLP